MPFSESAGLLLYLDQLLAVGVQDARLGDEAQVVVLFVDDGQHPLERELICGMEEHQHSVEQGCYQEIAAEPSQPI